MRHEAPKARAVSELPRLIETEPVQVNGRSYHLEMWQDEPANPPKVYSRFGNGYINGKGLVAGIEDASWQPTLDDAKRMTESFERGERGARPKGLSFERLLNAPGVNPYDSVVWVKRV